MKTFRPIHVVSVAVALALQLSANGASTASAQQPRPLERPESVPYELASALISAGGLPGDPQILVGSIPEWALKKLYVPADARVLGAAFIGTTVVGVASVKAMPEAAAADVRTGLLARGWKNPPPQPNYGGGFRPAPVSAAVAGATRGTLCGDQEMLTTSAVSQRGTATILTYRLVSTTGYTLCRPPEMVQAYPRSPIPTLYNPPTANDARMTGDCSGTMGNSNGTSTTLRTSLASEALLEHYGKQLADSGWTSSGDKPMILGRTWTRRDSAGAPLELSISIVTSPRDANCRDASLQVRTLSKP